MDLYWICIQHIMFDIVISFSIYIHILTILIIDILSNFIA